MRPERHYQQIRVRTLRPRDNGHIRIESLDFGLTVECDLQSELAYDGKLDMAKAAIRNLGGQSASGFDLFLHTDVPPGSGLGSSSTLMIAVVDQLLMIRQNGMSETKTIPSLGCAAKRISR